MDSNLSIKNYVNQGLDKDIPIALLVFSDNVESILETNLIKDDSVKTIYQRALKNKHLTGKTTEIYPIHSLNSDFSEYLFLGLGSEKDSDFDNFRLAGAALCTRMRKFNLEASAFQFTNLDGKPEVYIKRAAQAFVEGFMLRNYDFSKYREKSHEGSVKELFLLEENEVLRSTLEQGISEGMIFSRATNFCRDIANEPSNFMTPEIMAQRALSIAEDSNELLKCHIFDKKDLENFNMGCFLGVAKAGGSPPRMIVLEYFGAGSDKPVIGLVGKGITFDSGGISLKNSSGMFHMKRDMSGAAAVLGTMKGLSELKIPVNVVAIIGATENMPGSNAYKPGDVLTSMSGKTVEIINTDAEGRLVLADILTYVQREYKPSFLIDIATLTGAVQRALGGVMSGAFTNNKDLLNKLKISSELSNEPMWELPLEPKLFKNPNKSYFADLKNSSDKPPGGTKAALFLYEFIENNVPWVHLDIAGTETASGEPSSYYPRGATGVCTRTFLEFLKIVSIED